MRGSVEYNPDDIRKALRTYFEIEPKVRDLETVGQLRETLNDRDYSRYIHALNCLGKLKVDGFEIIETLADQDHSPEKYGALVKILSNSETVHPRKS